MKTMKSLLTCIFWLLVIALMVAPLGLIYQISNDEMAQYTTPTAPVLRETAIGSIAKATRQDVAVYVTVSGSFTASESVYQELDYKNPDKIRWLVSHGDEVQVGQVIGTYNGENVVSEHTGIIEEMNTYGTDAYLRIGLFEPVELSCRLDDRTLSILKRSDSLLTDNGETVTLLYASQQKNPDGTTNVRLTIDTDKYTYGEALSGLCIMTGQVYQRTMVLPVDCVYQKTAGENEPWFVRQVSAEGIFLTEREIQIGYSNGDYVCVTGVEEGEYFDMGYKAIVGG